MRCGNTPRSRVCFYSVARGCFALSRRDDVTVRCRTKGQAWHKRKPRETQRRSSVCWGQKAKRGHNAKCCARGANAGHKGEGESQESRVIQSSPNKATACRHNSACAMQPFIRESDTRRARADIGSPRPRPRHRTPHGTPGAAPPPHDDSISRPRRVAVGVFLSVHTHVASPLARCTALASPCPCLSLSATSCFGRVVCSHIRSSLDKWLQALCCDLDQQRVASFGALAVSAFFFPKHLTSFFFRNIDKSVSKLARFQKICIFGLLVGERHTGSTARRKRVTP